ncbi:MAG TPA: glycosyltransferase family 39 protein, partial [Adhaeribacter sp.]|nr:glycosyltransferase family 39 protein [Adhaeribacter sp.]
MSFNLTTRNPYLKPLAAGLFFGILLVTGLFIYKDYGVSWDERINQENGVISAIYVAKKLYPGPVSPETVAAFPALHQYSDKDYGVFFDLISFGIEQGFKLTEVRDLYLMRHLLTFVFSFIGIAFFYRLISERFNNWKWGLAGAFFLVLSPRLFAEGFYNSKDAVFMSLFCVASFTMLRFLKNPGYQTAFWHALATAIAINSRITAVVIPALTLAVLFINFLGPEAYRFRNRKLLFSVLVYLSFGFLLTVLFWPYLWENPVGNFGQAFKNMSAFRWKNHVLYLGKMTLSDQLPWHYFPVWLFITTPLLYSFLFGTGLVLVLKNWFGNFRQAFRPGWLQQDLVFLALFLGPALAVIVLNSVLYDGWRQLYFLYIPFLYLALRGLYGLWHGFRNKKLQLAIGLVVVLQTAHTLYFMVQYHPFQFMYFSFLRGEQIEKNFERDYWGVSVRRGLEYIL